MSNTGQIGASDAAAFLKKSGLKEGVLHKVNIYPLLIEFEFCTVKYGQLFNRCLWPKCDVHRP